MRNAFLFRRGVFLLSELLSNSLFLESTGAHHFVSVVKAEYELTREMFRRQFAFPKMNAFYYRLSKLGPLLIVRCPFSISRWSFRTREKLTIEIFLFLTCFRPTAVHLSVWKRSI